jgi:2-keto-4-pentenoate hydratase/2-oxohepta-3-ene-1,7-dioic acid hydratase in catechol pathway
MRLCQFYHSAEARAADLAMRFPTKAALGMVIDGKIVDITAWAAKHHDLNDPQYAGVLTACVAHGAEWAALREEIKTLSGRDGLPPEQVFFGPCVLRPSQYLDFYAFEQHVMTMRKKRGFDFIVPEWYEIPAYYNSNPTSLLGHGMTAVFPRGEEKMDYECEMACIIGRPIRNATPETARAAIAGYTVLNDLSARARQTKAIRDLGALGMRAYVNGEKWTDGRYGTVQHSFEAMIVFASASRWLYPGDVLGSGTVGGGCGAELGRFLKVGDVVRVEIDELGAVENRVELDQ